MATAFADEAWAGPALRDLIRARRRNRAAGVDVFEGFYQAYLTAFGCGVAVLLASDAVGDVRLTPAQVSDVSRHGPPLIGLGVALILFVAFRSGGRGGPLVLPAADVRHVLLAPVPRGLALRPSAIRQLRFSAFVGMVAGAGMATVASHRFTGGVPLWAVTGGAVGLGIGLLAAGVGLFACGRGLPSSLAGFLGLVLLAWSGLDVALGRVTSPMGLLGSLALSPVTFHPADLAVIVVIAVVAVVAVLGIGGLSIEQAERRATLASQIRFALTLQDLRTVVLLRRQLTQEQSRARPWFKLGPLTKGRQAVWRRDLRGVLRWPAVRLFRVLVLSAVAGACLVGVWAGTSPLIVVAALALFLAGLEALEPLAQDVDHPDIPAALPVVPGELRIRHVVVPFAVMVVVGLIGWGTAVAITAATGGSMHVVLSVGPAMLLPVALLGTVGATLSVILEPSMGGSDFLPAEIAGVKTVVRAIFTPALVLLGLTPLLTAHTAFKHHTSIGGGAASGGLLPLMVGVLGLGYVRFREDFRTYMKPPPVEAAAK